MGLKAKLLLVLLLLDQDVGLVSAKLAAQCCLNVIAMVYQVLLPCVASNLLSTPT